MANIRRQAIIIAALVAAAGCDEDRPTIDPFPIRLDPGGAVTSRASLDDGDAVPAVIDTLSPQSVEVVSGAEATRTRADLMLWGAGGDAGASVPRARFDDTTVYAVDPCGPAEPCRVGMGAGARPFELIVGSDALSRVAVRLDFPASELRLFPDIALDDRAHARACKAVVRGPFAGGGTLIVGGAEESFQGRRPALGACMNFQESPRETQRGVSALLLLSTAVGPTVLGESAYARYRGRTNAPPASELPTATLHLPVGPVEARLGQIDTLTLAGEESDERGACTEIYANRLMRRDACASGEVTDCPCPEDFEFCRTGAVVELGGPIEVAVIPDDHRALQALREELRPAFPDVDGILGTSALADVRVDLDYPNNRILFECRGDGDCLTRPSIESRSSRDRIDHCPET